MAASRGTKKRPSMFEVAHLAGVSHQTVSRVINDSPDVSDATRARVQEAIRQLGYRPSNSARALASHRSRTIGLIAGGLRFFGPISAIASIESTARSHGLYLSVAMVHEAVCSQEEFDSLTDMFNGQNVDAFILLTPTDVMFEAVCRARIGQPRVILTSTHGAVSMREGMALLADDERSHTTVLGIDQWGAMEGIMRRALAQGHRSSIYFAGPDDWRDAVTRREAWDHLAAENAMRSQTVRCTTWDAAEAYAKMNRVLETIGRTGAPLPTLVVTANDNQAVGVARSLHEHGMRVPQDVSLVGFDDMPAMDCLHPPLTTVRPDFAELGTCAMREVLHMLGEGAEPTYVATHHGAGLIPATVVDRSSLGPASRP